MISRTTRRFREAYARLPDHAQRRAREAYRRFRDNPQHPSLRFKQVHATEPIYAARVGLGYRALASSSETSLSGSGSAASGLRSDSTNAVSHRVELQDSPDGLRPRVILGVRRPWGLSSGGSVDCSGSALLGCSQVAVFVRLCLATV